jgi:HEXXH motif-containing protein
MTSVLAPAVGTHGAVFACSPQRAQACDHTLRAALADSIAHVHEAGLQPAGIGPSAVRAALGEIRAHRIQPGLFGRYYDMVLALRGGRPADAAALLREIVDGAGETPVLAVLPFSGAALGADQARYNRLLDLAAETPALLAPPDHPRMQNFAENVAAGLALLARADADMAAELRALIVQIIGAVPPAAASRGFEGASSFMLWGAVVLNVERHGTPLDAAAGLVHEAAHQLLFGLSQDAPLIENPPAETFPSPLRRGPRPMLGVFHATFVCARLVHAYRRLHGAAAPAARGLIAARLAAEQTRFRDGYETVRQHARLTANGAAIMAAALAAMQAGG